jgi:hypothetical protein
MRLSADLDLRPATAWCEDAFCFGAACFAVLVAGESDETKGDEAVPMSPWNHIHVCAVAAFVTANAVMKVMNIVFIVIFLVV